MAHAAGPGWVEERTLGGRARAFWWRVDAEGGLWLRRLESARNVARGVQERRVSREELDRLAGFLADGAWHALASGATAARSGTEGIGPFLHRGLGWAAGATVLASHLAAVLTRAGVWEWDGRRQPMGFRQGAGAGGEGLARHYERRRAEAGESRAVPRRRGEAGRVEPPRFDLAERFRALSRGLRARFEEADSGGRHAAEKGQRREGVVREFLRAQLPPCYGVTRGEVASATGEVSRQVDVLVYDAWRTPPLLESEGSRLLPVESVYAAIEVKPRLTVTELRGAVANVRSVKALGGAAAQAAGVEATERPIFGAIFSFEAMDHRLLGRELRELQGGRSVALWVDCVCVLDEALIYRMSGTPYLWALPVPVTETGALACVAAGTESLLVFTLMLLADLNAKTLRAPNLLHYAQGFGLPEPEML